MGVNLGGANAHMPQHLLDKADIRPVIQHQRGHRMAEQVATAGFANVRLFDVFGHQTAQAIRG